MGKKNKIARHLRPAERFREADTPVGGFAGRVAVGDARGEGGKGGVLRVGGGGTGGGGAAGGG